MNQQQEEQCKLMRISPTQLTYGNELIESYMKKHQLTKMQAIKILRDINTMHEFYEWFNGDFYLDIAFQEEYDRIHSSN
jgi:hypothetical protein